jgi:glutamyl-tRNA reductase
MNRTRANAQALSEKYAGTVVSFFDMKEILGEVDACICSVSAPHYILEKEIVSRVMPSRAGRPLVFIDISMPRNIDPRVAEIEGVSLYQMDDLKEVVDSNMKAREKAATEVREIIRHKTSEFFEKIKKADYLSADDEHEDKGSLTPI